jgi:hypothetical protein
MEDKVPGGLPAAIIALVVQDGSAAHSYVGGDELLRGRHATRNLADAIHHFGYLHGRHPGVVASALLKTPNSETKDWFEAAVDGFDQERSYLTRLVVAVGPTPSTPGQAECEAALTSQHHAIEMLSHSERLGCAFGAAAALILDWAAIRVVMDRAAERFGLIPPRCTLPQAAETAAAIRTIAAAPAAERALSLGAQQLLAQHRGLWDLLESRQVARGEY